MQEEFKKNILLRKFPILRECLKKNSWSLCKEVSWFPRIIEISPKFVRLQKRNLINSDQLCMMNIAFNVHFLCHCVRHQILCSTDETGVRFFGTVIKMIFDTNTYRHLFWNSMISVSIVLNVAFFFSFSFFFNDFESRDR